MGVKIKSEIEVCKKKKKEGMVPTRRPDKYTEDTEHARTISRNVDDFLEVERRGNKVAASFLIFFFQELKYEPPKHHSSPFPLEVDGLTRVYSL